MDLIKDLCMFINNNFSFRTQCLIFCFFLILGFFSLVDDFNHKKDEKPDNEDNKSDKNICKEIRED